MNMYIFILYIYFFLFLYARIFSPRTFFYPHTRFSPASPRPAGAEIKKKENKNKKPPGAAYRLAGDGSGRPRAVVAGGRRGIKDGRGRARAVPGTSSPFKTTLAAFLALFRRRRFCTRSRVVRAHNVQTIYPITRVPPLSSA